MLKTRDTGPSVHVGHPVVLVHSSGMTSRQWGSLTSLLSPRYRVVAPDLLGYGENGTWPPDAPFRFHDDVGALGEVIDSLDQAVHLVGHSYGGLLAITYARMFPERLRSLSVYEPVAMGLLYEASDHAGIANLMLAENAEGFFDEEVGGTARWWNLFVDYWNGKGAWDGLPDSTRAGFLKVGKKAFREVKSLLEDRTGRAAYGSITCPTLLLTGKHSPLAAGRVIVHLGAAIPQARTVVLETAGHMSRSRTTRK